LLWTRLLIISKIKFSFQSAFEKIYKTLHLLFVFFFSVFVFILPSPAINITVPVCDVWIGSLIICCQGSFFYPTASHSFENLFSELTSTAVKSHNLSR
jgi:hypothetical protein